MKLKVCKECKENKPLSAFTSTRAKYCNQCKLIVRLKQQKEAQNRAFSRLQNRKQKKQVVTRISDLKKQTQKVFNKWVRIRDSGEKCLACTKMAEKMDASHFISQGSSGYLRFHPDNIHNTCYSCNRFKHGNLIEYRINLVEKIGEDRVKWLEENRRKTHSYTRDQLLKIIEYCKYNTFSVEYWYETLHKL